MLTRLEATDADTGHNAELEYGIASGHDDDLFDIDPLTGVITVGRGMNVDRLAGVQQIRLVVLVKDKGFPPQQEVADLYVTVNDTGTIAAETGRLGVAETADSGANVAIVAVIGVAVGGTLVIICVVAVAVAVCVVKRRNRQRLQQQQQREKQQNSR